MAAIANQLELVAQTATAKVNKHMFFRELLDAFPEEERKKEENFSRENLERMEAFTCA